MASVVASGMIRISGPVSTFTAIPFSGLFTASVYQIHTLQLTNGISDFILSLGTFSNPGAVIAIADQIVRINYGNEPSAVSHGSAGRQFKDLWAQMGSGISGPLALHFANSSGQTASIVVIQGM